jgi:glycosyltransferase involved in cell wall biosynthesis
MKINWFSPLPPARTDIGHYTGRILPALSRVADVVLWTDQAGWDASLEEYGRVRQYHAERPPWFEINQADATFYNIGNNAEFHLGIWQVSTLHPGVVVLHDVCLQEFFAYVYRWINGDFEGYRQRMGSLYGDRGQIDAELWWNDQLSMAHMIERYPLTELALANALGVVVHTEPALAAARQQGCPAAFAPLPFGASASTVPRPHTPNPPYRLIVFGYIHRNRRLESLLHALAQSPERHLFRLDIYGEVAERARIEAEIHALNLALDAADLAVNLRFPSMGEASGSQLRIWNHALPSLVSRVGAYATLPEDVVGFVRPEHEIDDLHSHLRAFLLHPTTYVRMGERGRRRLEELHSPEAYARTIERFASRAQVERLRIVTEAMVERAAGQLGAWISPSAGRQLFSRLAESIELIAA